MVGLVFHDRSPRNVGLGLAARLRVLAEGRAELVALTADADDTMLDAIVSAVRPDRLQLHGTETPERVAAINARFGLSTLKAIAVHDRSDIDGARDYRGIADMILFDAKPPAGALLPGGNGIPFDWRLLEDAEPPFMLSGGLDAGNVGEAIGIARPVAVDVSSGVETAPGRKDSELIRAFVLAAHQAAATPAEATT